MKMVSENKEITLNLGANEEQNFLKYKAKVTLLLESKNYIQTSRS